MTRDDIIRTAREAGLMGPYSEKWPYIEDEEVTEFAERFAALVAAAEREACAKVCEDIPAPKDPTELTHIPTLERCAAAIRARGDTP